MRQESRRSSPSPRRPRAYENTETHAASKQWIPSSVREIEGRSDKIHFVCNIATVLCKTKEDATSFVLHCGNAPLEQRGEHDLFSKLFTTASLNGNGNELRIRSFPMTCDGELFQAPCFTGKLQFRRVPYHQTDEESGIALLITADLCLNVNRALNHRRAELAEGGQDAIFESAAPVKLGLCGNDNLAPFDLESGEHDRARRTCITAVIDAIYADVKRAADSADEAGSEIVEVREHPSNFSLWEVETCWDIGGSGFDAVQALADITPALHEHGGKQCSEGNAKAVTIEFSKYEHLIVYAKAPDRLRLEIRHYPRNGSLPYSSPTIPETLSKLDRLRESAADKLNGVLSFLEARPAASRTAGEWEAFAMAWGACCGITAPAKALYGILRQLGRIYGGKSIQCVQGGEALLRKARDAGLIRHSHGAFRPVFPNATDAALTDFDSAALILGHNSETQPVPVCSASPGKIRNGREWKQIPPSPRERSEQGEASPNAKRQMESRRQSHPLRHILPTQGGKMCPP
ncbi:hypothetical protein [Prosthecobacter sp.]|uniref:hypothetical protein n=1 Tax=Prosthecobacter sp. TaxID=1965333 RepID=UPI0025F20E30|nr:hypothetical protein [Prosthecobacter sp.]